MWQESIGKIETKSNCLQEYDDATSIQFKNLRHSLKTHIQEVRIGSLQKMNYDFMNNF